MNERKKFDKAFKEQAILRVISKEMTIRQMADEIGVHYTTVRDWVRLYKIDGADALPGSGNLKPEDDEVRKLRRELADLKGENAILKKAAAYFAKNQE